MTELNKRPGAVQVATLLTVDTLNNPNAGDTTVYILNIPSPILKEQLIKKYPMKELISLRVSIIYNWI